MGFAERYGHEEARSVIQVDDLDEHTRIDLWDLTYLYLGDWLSAYKSPDDTEFAPRLWRYLHQPLSSLPYSSNDEIRELLQSFLMEETYYRVLDIFEFLATQAKGRFSEFANKIFTDNLVGYRFVSSGDIAPVTEAVEVEAIDDALSATTELPGAHNNLQRALTFLSDRENPNYAKAFTESIAAVEAVARYYTGERTLADALKKLEPNGVEAHPALQQGWNKIYGYASDTQRHGDVDAKDVDEALATYFVVSCSAFVGYLVKKGGEKQSGD